jgi:predicted nucleic acid-binding protein
VTESVVADTTCLIALERIDRLDLLERSFSSVIIPPEVAREFGTALDWLEIRSPSNHRVLASLRLQVDEGEAAAIALAHELKVRIILDDGAGRSAARQFGLSVMGTIGLLLMAKRRGLVPSVRPIIDDLKRHGFYMTEDLKQEALRLAGE